MSQREGFVHCEVCAKLTPKAFADRHHVTPQAVGKQADLAMFTLDEMRFSGNHDPIAALVHCGATRADRVMVAGEWRVIDGAIPGLDVPALIAEHSNAARIFD